MIILAMTPEAQEKKKNYTSGITKLKYSPQQRMLSTE
jgi:hypothetical protein